MNEYLLPDQDDNIIRTLDFKSEFSGKCLGVVFFNQMKKFQSNIAQIDAITGESNTYGELLEESIRTAIEMKNRGIKEDDIICICSPNNLKACVPYIAGLFLGAQINALDPMLSSTDMKHLLKQVPPNMIFSTQESQNILEEIVNSLALESTEIIPIDSVLFEEFLTPKSNEGEFTPVVIKDVFKTAVIFASSGTTDLPKEICINHYSLIQQSNTMGIFGFNLGTILGFTSLCWISSVNILICSVLFGKARLICPNFDADQTWLFLDKFNVAVIIISSLRATLLVKSDKPANLKLQSLKRIFVGAAPVSSGLMEELQYAFPNTQIIQGYGWTEVGGIITISKAPANLTLSKDKAQSCGEPIPGIWYKVVDYENGNIVGPNTHGELRLKTDCQMNGYYNMDSSDAWDSEGWIKTGDAAYYDEDYCFYIIDRIKEFIKYKQWRVSPAQLEGIILKHPAVKMAAVIGIPHNVDNEHPLALVVLKKTDGSNNVNEEQLRQFVDDQIDDSSKLRAGVKFVDNIPQNSAGKIKRYALKTRILSQLGYV